MIYQTKSPILFLVFNRPLETLKVFNEIKKAKPSKLYLAADGSRVNNESDHKNCIKVKEIIEKIDWDCEVFKRYNEKNFGCKYAVSNAISWFFEHEEMGIILEDDCLPTSNFFRFCDEILEKYKEDQRIRTITGSNFNFGERIGESSYYFSRLTHVWGWASWRRAWQDYDVELLKYKNKDYNEVFKNLFHNDLLAEDWNNVIQKLFKNEIDTWDYQWTITNLFNNGLSIIPNVNLIKNIGFGENATHTLKSSGLENMEFQELENEIKHPTIFLPSYTADLKTLFREHQIEKRTKLQKKKVLGFIKF
jgi:hypothetical protein